MAWQLSKKRKGQKSKVKMSAADLEKYVHQPLEKRAGR